MRKISESKLHELHKSGVKVFADGRRVLHRMRTQEQAAPQPQPQPVQPVEPVEPANTKNSELLLEMMKIQGETQGIMVQYGEMVAACVAELSKPKPMKKWQCSVSRGTDGQINNIDITERPQ
jgi:hypothetical protein